MKEKVILRNAETAAQKITEYSKEYLRSADVCEIFSISNSTLKWLRNTGQIPYYILGQKTFLYKKEEIEAILIPSTQIK